MTESVTNMQWAAVCVCSVAFVWVFHHTAIQRANLSSRCRLNPTVQTRFSAYSSKIRTWVAALLKLQQEVSDCTSIIRQAGQRWRGNDDPSLWSLCVYTEEQYVVVKQSWMGFLNPLQKALSFNYSLQLPAHIACGFIGLMYSQIGLRLRPVLLMLWMLNKCYICQNISWDSEEHRSHLTWFNAIKNIYKPHSICYNNNTFFCVYLKYLAHFKYSFTQCFELFIILNTLHTPAQNCTAFLFQ